MYTWHFEIINTSDNKLPLLRNLFNEIIFENSGKLKDDKYLIKLTYYAAIHYDYINLITYKDIESSNFDFSVNRIPQNLSLNIYMNNMDNLSKEYNNYEDYYLSKSVESLAKSHLTNYQNKKQFLFNILKVKNERDVDDSRVFKCVANYYGINPYKDSTNFFEVDIEKGWRGKFNKFMKNELFHDDAIAIEKVSRGIIFYDFLNFLI